MFLEGLDELEDVYKRQVRIHLLPPKTGMFRHAGFLIKFVLRTNEIASL